MNDEELREMIRESIARAMGTGIGEMGTGIGLNSADPRPHTAHASFARLPLIGSGDADGACLIEPAVRCNHYGYCLSYGH